MVVEVRKATNILTNIKESYKKTTEEVLGYRKKSKVSPGYGLLAGRKSTKDLVKL